MVPRRQLSLAVPQCSSKSAVFRGKLFVINIFNRTTPLIEVLLVCLGAVNRVMNKNLHMASLFYCVTVKSILSFSLQPFHFQSNVLIIKNIRGKVHQNFFAEICSSRSFSTCSGRHEICKNCANYPDVFVQKEGGVRLGLSG